jgi:hypothetical protein
MNFYVARLLVCFATLVILLTSMDAGHAQAIAIDDLSFPDARLQACVRGQANSNGWEEVEEVTKLSCLQRGISGLEGIDQLINLTNLNQPCKGEVI